MSQSTILESEKIKAKMKELGFYRMEGGFGYENGEIQLHDCIDLKGPTSWFVNVGKPMVPPSPRFFNVVEAALWAIENYPDLTSAKTESEDSQIIIGYKRKIKDLERQIKDLEEALLWQLMEGNK